MNELKQMRKELGFTQIEAARVCCISRRMYQYYEESGKYNSDNSKIYSSLVQKLYDNRNSGILSIKFIIKKCVEVFSKHPEVRCAYLYGSYSRGEAKPESDVDILVVCPPMGMKFYHLAGELEDVLEKPVDLQTHRQIGDNERFLENILVDGICAYKKR